MHIKFDWKMSMEETTWMEYPGVDGGTISKYILKKRGGDGRGPDSYDS
jgi:hypothetical protein